MTKPNSIKTSPFKLAEDNKHHTYSVEWNGDSYTCVLPGPVAELYSTDGETETDAWLEILRIRNRHPSAKLWQIDNKTRCAEMVQLSIKAASVDRMGNLTSSWLFFEVGTSVADIHLWLNAEIGL